MEILNLEIKIWGSATWGEHVCMKLSAIKPNLAFSSYMSLKNYKAGPSTNTPAVICSQCIATNLLIMNKDPNLLAAVNS